MCKIYVRYDSVAKEKKTGFLMLMSNVQQTIAMYVDSKLMWNV